MNRHPENSNRPGLEDRPPIILVVDDTQEIRSALNRILTPDGYRVYEAENGQTALRIAEEARPDLILTDVMMPVMDGLELCRSVRARAELSEIPLLMVTALDDQESRLKGLDAGADDFLSKPFDPKELRTRVRVITRLNRYRKLVTERFQAMNLDRLTGLENRWRFVERVAEHLTAEEGSRWGLFAIALNHFRRINETFGSAIGDRLLQHFAQKLGTALGEEAFAARLSGAEFGVLARVGPGDAGLREKAIEIRDHLRSSYDIEPLELRIHVSVGAARPEPGNGSASELLQAADVALSQARRSADGVALFHSRMLSHVVRFVATAAELERAIEAQQIFPHFQPIVRLEGGQVVGFEALVRWRTQSGALRPPSDFLSVAEETGLIARMDMLILDASLAALRRWTLESEACRDLTMSVNVSARSLEEGGLLASLVAAAERHQVDLRRVRVELTESTLIGDVEARVAEFQALRELGVGVRIDDFGTGYSSLSYLSRLPIEALKIDRAFVQHMLTRPTDRAVARTVLELARSLGFGAIAEGIEEAAQAEVLRELGCKYGQGYHFARPMESDQVPAFVRARNISV